MQVPFYHASIFFSQSVIIMAPRTKKTSTVTVATLHRRSKELKTAAPCAPLHGKPRVRSTVGTGRCVVTHSRTLKDSKICLPRVITKGGKTKTIHMVPNPKYNLNSKVKGVRRCLRAGGDMARDLYPSGRMACDEYTQTYKQIKYTVPKIPKGRTPADFIAEWGANHGWKLNSAGKRIRFDAKGNKIGDDLPSKSVTKGRCVAQSGVDKICEIGQDLVEGKTGTGKGKKTGRFMCVKSGTEPAGYSFVRKGTLAPRIVKTRAVYKGKEHIHGGYEHPVIEPRGAVKPKRKVAAAKPKRKVAAAKPKKAQAAASSSVPLAARGAAKTTASKGKATAAAKAKAAKAKAAAAAKAKAAKAKATAAAKAKAAKAKGKTAAAKPQTKAAKAAKAAKAKAARAAKAVADIIEIVNEASSVQQSAPKTAKGKGKAAPKANRPKTRAAKAAAGLAV